MYLLIYKEPDGDWKIWDNYFCVATAFRQLKQFKEKYPHDVWKLIDVLNVPEMTNEQPTLNNERIITI